MLCCRNKLLIRWYTFEFSYSIRSGRPKGSEVLWGRLKSISNFNKVYGKFVSNIIAHISSTSTLSMWAQLLRGAYPESNRITYLFLFYYLSWTTFHSFGQGLDGPISAIGTVKWIREESPIIRTWLLKIKKKTLKGEV